MDKPEVVILRAAWVAPIASPTIANGAIAIADGRIADVGLPDELQARHPHAAVQDLGAVCLLPGLVNPHVHLELSDLTPGDPPKSFVDWLLAVMAKGPPPDGDARVVAATRAGIAQCLRFGVTTVGDITRFPQITRQALADSPLRAVSFGEVTAMGARRHLLEQRLAAAMTPSPAPDRIVSAVSPHAPYSIERDGYSRCIEAARHAGVPIASHVAESADESEFLTAHAGPFRRLWNTIGGWDEKIELASPGTTAIDHVAAAGLLRYAGGIVVHANHLSPADLDLLAARKASVVFCPRTHAYFGHPPHPWRELLSRGVNVAVGTDSTASSPDLNVVDDLRLLHRQSPDVPVETLWQLATVNAARALGMKGKVGELSIGAAADIVAFPASSSSPLVEILRSNVAPAAVWVGGVRM